MSETKDTADKSARSVTPAAPVAAGAGSAPVRKPLSLTSTRTEVSGHIRQSFPHGKSKSVVVEVKRKKTIANPGEGELTPTGRRETAAEEAKRLGLSRTGAKWSMPSGSGRLKSASNKTSASALPQKRRRKLTHLRLRRGRRQRPRRPQLIRWHRLMVLARPRPMRRRRRCRL
jgi:translation initiation factor IF-2